jgi:hypothetical protein
MKKNYFPLKLLLSTSKLLLMMLLVINYSNPMYSQNSNCNAKLNLENNETSKKAGESGVYFNFELTNTGNQKTVFIITVNDDFDTEDKSRGKNRVKLNGHILKMDLNEMPEQKSKVNLTTSSKNATSEKSYSIALNSGEIYKFYLKLDTPPNSKVGSINNSKVTVTSDACKDFNISQILYTEIIDSE